MRRTPLFDEHKKLGGYMVSFSGWEMPLYYSMGILKEHLNVRKYGGLFDVSHMGRFIITGDEKVDFLQYCLTNNCKALDVGQAQYTIIPDENGYAIDDAYLYRLTEDEYLLVVNAANIDKDWKHLNELIAKYNAKIEDKTEDIAMFAFQGPKTRDVLTEILNDGMRMLPEPKRNCLTCAKIDDIDVYISRTGYTGEPLCFEIFVDSKYAIDIWNMILSVGNKFGICPAGLGARDSLRLEAGLPLYGNELGVDKYGNNIPIFAISQAVYAVSLSPEKGDFVGRDKLREQLNELTKLETFDAFTDRKKNELKILKKRVYCLAIKEKQIVRHGDDVYVNNKLVGYITSGTLIPYWKFNGYGIRAKISDETDKRCIALAYLDAYLTTGTNVVIKSRRGEINGLIVDTHLGSSAPPYARAIWKQPEKTKIWKPIDNGFKKKVEYIVRKSISNTIWRSKECINLIPSENTPSPLVKLLTICDPMDRYAEHKMIKFLGKDEVYYYQATEFIEEIEYRLNDALREYFGCSSIETRVISGQMANAAVFSGLIEYLNRYTRKRCIRKRLQKVMAHHIGKGGHLSAQSLGPLRECVDIDAEMDKSGVINFPVLPTDPYRIDIDSTAEYIEKHHPELIILGKSLILYREPVSEIRKIIDEIGIPCMLMYDMAHVLGLVGKYFQEPFVEGADIVTGSTHKTFFGTQRGIIASNFEDKKDKEKLWECIVRRVFPGSVSNHHLGTQLGLLLATYEMNTFRDEYQKQVITNAKSFAKSLKEHGVNIEGSPSIGYTETHQVLINVGYGKGIEMAHRLEKNNIIVNYQSSPYDESFTVASCLRTGVQEMTRFGMKESDFEQLAEYIAEIIIHGKNVKDKIKTFRKEFTEMKYCLPIDEAKTLINELIEIHTT